MSGSLPEGTYRLLICVTGALLAALLLRLPLRHTFGPRIAYTIWLLVPLAALGSAVGSLVPVRTFAPDVLPVPMLDVRLLRSPVPSVDPSLGETNWIVLWWIIGTVVLALAQQWQQYAFVRRLGGLRRTSIGAWRSESDDIGPVVVGVLPPRIVLPSDFQQRYTRQERALVLAHERMHLIRRDPLANFVVAVVRSLLWFHPLVHLASRYFRIDQELACDAAVLEARPQDRYRYAHAILKTQLGKRELAAGCCLASRTASSLKRRIIMLRTPAPSWWRRLLGTATVAMAWITGASLAWAIQSPPTPASTDSAVQNARLRLQGSDSLRTDDPIVIVDGVRAKALDQVDPNRIQSIEVLKGPSAVSRYGQDAAHGVIVVTTKPGRQSDTVRSVTDLLDARVPGLTVQRSSGTPGDPERLKLRDTEKPRNRSDTVRSVIDLLDARVPGLTVQRTAGAPGDPARLRLRGAGSVLRNSDPVVIVDGVRVQTVDGTPPLDYIDPNSIQTIEVMKGPSAARLYGQDAAGGVVVITTKKP